MCAKPWSFRYGVSMSPFCRTCHQVTLNHLRRECLIRLVVVHHQGISWRNTSPEFSFHCSSSESESYVTTDGQSASLSWNKAPIWGLRPDFYYRRTVAGLLMWGALSDERTGLSFTIAAGPCQRSHSLVRAPLDSRPCFTVSDLRLPISSPPTTRRCVTAAEIEVLKRAYVALHLLLSFHYILSTWCDTDGTENTASNNFWIQCE
jgi:hypothetical protein